MFQFATTCVDNFFKYPDSVRKFAETLEYKPEPKGMWSGKRTAPLNAIAPSFYNAVCNKYLQCHFSTPIIGYNAVAHFQKVDAKSNNGWVHNDTPHLHTCLIYLTPDPNLNSGTSIFRPKQDASPMLTTRYGSTKKRDFNLGKIDAKEAEKFRVESNNDFEEIIRFANVYNRCIGFDASNWHSANEYAQKKDKTSRLTLIIFWNEIVSGQTEIQRSHMQII